MVLYINPHTLMGDEQTILQNLSQAYKLHLNCLELSDNIDSLLDRVGHAILRAWQTDLLAIIAQLENIKYTVSTYPDSEIRYQLHKLLSYGLIDEEGRSLIAEEYCQKHNLHLDGSNIKNNSDKQIHSFGLKYTHGEQTLLFLDNSWSQYLPKSKNGVIIPTQYDTESDKRKVGIESVNILKELEKNVQGIYDSLPEPSRVIDKISHYYQFIDYHVAKNHIVRGREKIINTHLPLSAELEGILQQKKYKRIAMWNDWYPPGQVVRELSRQRQLQVDVFQHGMFLYEPIYLLSRPDRFFVFSENEYQKINQYFQLVEFEPTIHILNYPITLDEFQFKRSNYDILVILQLLHLTPELHQLLEWIIDLATNFSELTIALRRHPRDTSEYWKRLQLPPNMRLTSGTLQEDMEKSGCVLGINSSALVEAAFLGIPVLEYQPKGMEYSYVAPYTDNHTIIREKNDLYQVFQSPPRPSKSNIQNFTNRSSYLRSILGFD